MRRLAIAVSAAAIFLAVPVAGLSQGKMTSDPNAGRQAVAPAAVAPDSRLDQKITYDSGSKRLHDVVDDLSRISGVKIFSGISKEDWRVRDIPVIICVKDMTLARLLRAIADATHTRLTSEKIGDDTEKSYRIYRRSVDQSAIDTYFQEKYMSNQARAKWNWDAMAKYAKSEEIAGVPKNTWLIAQLIGSLGPDARAKILNGDTLVIDGKDAATQTVFQELYTSFWKSFATSARSTETTPTQQEMEAAKVAIKLHDDPETGVCEIRVSMDDVIVGHGRYAKNDAIDAKALLDKGLDLPPYPEAPEVPSYEEDISNPSMIVLDKTPKWDRPELKAKFDLEKPKDTKEVTLPDTMRLLASASGINIVLEDFSSHCSSDLGRPWLRDRVFQKQTCLADILHPNSQPWLHIYLWFVDQNADLLVGWTDDSYYFAEERAQRRWRYFHRNLVSEKYLTSMQDRLDSPSGVELDDAVSLTTLPDASFTDWFFFGERTKPLRNARPIYKDAWGLYNALTPEDKKLARSSTGLPLSKFDPEWIAGFFHAEKMRAFRDVPWVSPTATDEQREQILREHALKNRAKSDPAIIRTMVMRVLEKKADSVRVDLPEEKFARYYNVWGDNYTSQLVNILEPREYSMTIDYKIDNETHTMNIQGPNASFPVRSAKKLIEILDAEAKKKQKAGK